MRVVLVVAMQLAFANLLQASDFQVVPLAIINPKGDAYINLYGTLDDTLIFEAFNGQTEQLFSTDGTSVQQLDIGGLAVPRAEPLSDYSLGGSSRSVIFQGAVYFVGDATAGRTLYKTDGIVTTPVLSGVSGVVDYDVYLPPQGQTASDYLYVTKNIGSDPGLYRTDGISATRVETGLPISTNTKFFSPLAGDAILYSSDSSGGVFFRENATALTEIAFGERILSPAYPTVFRSELYFTGTRSTGQGLFRTDGSQIVQVPSADTFQGIQSLLIVNDTMYFKARDATGYEQVYRTDGEQIELFDLGFLDQSSTNFITSFDDDLYIYEYARRRIVRVHGESIVDVSVGMKPDVGSASFKGRLGDTALLDLSVGNLGVAGSFTRGLFLLKDSAATFVDINGGNAYVPSNVTIIGDEIFFTAAGAHGNELFRISGGQLTEYDINPSGSSSANLDIIDDALYVTATGPGGRELYLAEGGLLKLIDFSSSGYSVPRLKGEIGGALLISANGQSGEELLSLRSIPEPSGWLLLLTSGIIIVARRRR
jgi:hypothetical protein